MAKKIAGFIGALFFITGCVTSDFLGTLDRSTLPPEFHQKVRLEVSDKYELYQATRSGYDVGDLQAFHSQHTFPITVEGLFKEIFDQVEMVNKEGGITTAGQDELPVFEVNIIDMANDIYNEAPDYRGEITIAAALKSPRGQVFWQKALRGEGYARVDPQFSTGLGPQEAMLDAVRDAMDQLAKTIINSPEVRLHLKHYQEIEQARREKEFNV
ncbi:MAG: hypothetical protein PHN49_06395 [Candidatus Omnitrophica bacterium]|nr:hypothetical protein [Candidatus Omnitrophota bacterium]MDD5671248.1 hypothetical protein [Candidatus Omnitrophota bacterium]